MKNPDETTEEEFESENEANNEQMNELSKGFNADKDNIGGVYDIAEWRDVKMDYTDDDVTSQGDSAMG